MKLADKIRLSQEAIKLRGAAQEFWKEHPEPRDDDREGLKRWRALAKAAVVFAARVQWEERNEHVYQPLKETP